MQAVSIIDQQTLRFCHTQSCSPVKLFDGHESCWQSDRITNECKHFLAQPAFRTGAQGSRVHPASSLGVTVTCMWCCFSRKVSGPGEFMCPGHARDVVWDGAQCSFSQSYYKEVVMKQNESVWLKTAVLTQNISNVWNQLAS